MKVFPHRLLVQRLIRRELQHGPAFVLGGDDDCPGTDDLERSFDPLVRQHEVGDAEASGQLVDLLWRRVSSPRPLVDAPAASEAWRGVRPGGHVIAGLGHSPRGRQGVEHHHAARRARGDGDRQQKLVNGRQDFPGRAGLHGTSHTRREGLADAAPALGDLVAGGLGDVVVAQQEYHLLGVGELEPGRAKKHIHAAVAARAGVRIAVDDLLEHQPAVGPSRQIGEGDDLHEVLALAVKVARGDNLLAGLDRQRVARAARVLGVQPCRLMEDVCQRVGHWRLRC